MTAGAVPAGSTAQAPVLLESQDAVEPGVPPGLSAAQRGHLRCLVNTGQLQAMVAQVRGWEQQASGECLSGGSHQASACAAAVCLSGRRRVSGRGPRQPSVRKAALKIGVCIFVWVCCLDRGWAVAVIWPVSGCCRDCAPGAGCLWSGCSLALGSLGPAGGVHHAGIRQPGRAAERGEVAAAPGTAAGQRAAEVRAKCPAADRPVQHNVAGS